jgi:hypothetical protein
LLVFSLNCARCAQPRSGRTSTAILVLCIFHSQNVPNASLGSQITRSQVSNKLAPRRMSLLSADADLAPGYGVNGLRSRTALPSSGHNPRCPSTFFSCFGSVPISACGRLHLLGKSDLQSIDGGLVRMNGLVGGPHGCRVFRFQGQLHDHDLIIIVIIRILLDFVGKWPKL